MDWTELVTAGFAGGLIVKLLDILYQEFRGRSAHRKSARQFVDENLDPVLKTANELAGKLGSLARDDFEPLRSGPGPHPDNHDYIGLLYLLANFWASIERFRQKGLSVSITQDNRGQIFSNFVDCLESRKVRIVDRISQRAIAESVLVRVNGEIEVSTFIEFVRRFNNCQETAQWLTPVVHVVSRTQHTMERQMLLQYGTIIHAMIDTLDSDHKVTSDRPAYPNKLSKRTWRSLKYRVFGVYLKSVSNPEKYLGPPKRRP